MPALLAWLSKLAANPVVAGVLMPAIRGALITFFENQARKLEIKATVNAAKSAKTVEEMREASKRLSDLSIRR